MQQLLSQLSSRYGLTDGEVRSAVEEVFSDQLSRWHGSEVMALFQDDGLEAASWRPRDGIMQQQELNLTTMRGGNHLRRRLERHLLKMAVIKQTRLYKYCEKELRTGEVVGIEEDGALHVEVEIVPGEPIIAHCPSAMLPPGERGSFSIGSKAQFHLRRIEAIALNGTPRLKVVVDRTSKTLVEKLLRKELGYLADGMAIRCTKRYVGGKSFVETSRRIPKEAILAVRKELGEHIEVKIRREERVR